MSTLCVYRTTADWITYDGVLSDTALINIASTNTAKELNDAHDNTIVCDRIQIDNSVMINTTTTG